MKISSLKEEEFIKYASTHKYESMYQTVEYAKYQMNLQKFEIKYVGFYENEELVGASLLLFKPLFWGYKYAYAPRGFLIDYSDVELLNKVTNALKQMLYKQKFIFIKIDPPIIVSERDMQGKITYMSESINVIMKALRKNNYEHMGFNIYNETKLPRWNAYVKLEKTGKDLLNQFDEQRQTQIKNSVDLCVNIKEDPNKSLEDYYDIVKDYYPKKKIKFFENIFNSYGNKLDIYYAFVNTQEYADNLDKLYNQEEIKFKNLCNLIENGDRKKYNIAKIIEDKEKSNIQMQLYKKNLNISAQLLRDNPNGIVLGAALVVKQTNGANIFMYHLDPKYKNFDCNALFNFELINHYTELNYKFMNLGAVSGNFAQDGKYYKYLQEKAGLNSSIIEYIGEFNLIINPLMYKVYKRKEKNNKL